MECNYAAMAITQPTTDSVLCTDMYAVRKGRYLFAILTTSYVPADVNFISYDDLPENKLIKKAGSDGRFKFIVDGIQFGFTVDDVLYYDMTINDADNDVVRDELIVAGCCRAITIYDDLMTIRLNLLRDEFISLEIKPHANFDDIDIIARN